MRGIAVIFVILFHAGFDLFSGGYIGVDIFFVISGYLITLILIDNLASDLGSIWIFYKHRALRILPALFFIMITCIPCAYVWMTPSELQSFFKSFFTATLFSSNIYFWKSVGYFDAQAELKPLLHTWSLAVEMQFYAIFPLFLYWIRRFEQRKIIYILITLALISFLISEWGWKDNKTANFYLLTSRAWELLAGAIAALCLKNFQIKNNNYLSCIGLLLIIFSQFIYYQKTETHSFFTLIPVLGIVLILLYSGTETFVSKILSQKLFCRIGLASYSIYLWHYPIFSFARIREPQGLSTDYIILLILLSLGVGTLSWQYIEKPFRISQKINKKFLYITFSGLYFLLLIVGLLGQLNHTFFSNHLDKNNLQQLNMLKSSAKCVEIEGFNVFKACTIEISTKGKKVLVLGDSYSHSLKSYFEKYGQLMDIKSITFSANLNCSTVFKNAEELKSYNNNFCTNYYESLHKNSILEGIDIVIFWSRWHIPNSSNISLKEEFEIVKKRIWLFAKTAKVIVLSPVPTYSFDSYKIWKSNHLFKINENDRYTYARFRSELDWYYRDLKGSSVENIYLIDVAKFICFENDFCKLGDLYSPYYLDSNHPSVEFISLFGDELKRAIDDNK